jgi:hypothetical protein
MAHPSILHVVEEAASCGNAENEDTYFGLRIASLFIILVTSTLGAVFPVLASRLRFLSVHKSVFEYVDLKSLSMRYSQGNIEVLNTSGLVLSSRPPLSIFLHRLSVSLDPNVYTGCGRSTHGLLPSP